MYSIQIILLNTANCIHGQKTDSGVVASISVSALLVCILTHCRLRDWCGNLRNDGGHVVCRLDQSASFRIFDSTFYFPHSAIPHFTHCLRKHVTDTPNASTHEINLPRRPHLPEQHSPQYCHVMHIMLWNCGIVSDEITRLLHRFVQFTVALI